MSWESRNLLVQGIGAAKAGKAKEARYYFEWALRERPDLSQQLEAWYWMSQIATDTEEKRSFLELILSSDPFDSRARRELAILNAQLDPKEIIDPESYRSIQSPSVVEVTTKSFKCSSCGGELVFSPDGNSLICEYCSSRKNVAPATPEDFTKNSSSQDFLVGMATAKGHHHPSNIQAVSCQGGGASYLMLPRQISFNCPYCGSAKVVEEKETRELVAPAGVIPFSVTKEKAAELIKANLQLQDEELAEGSIIPEGVYLPAWIFAMSGVLPWTCEANQDGGWLPDSGASMVMREIAVLATDRLPEPLKTLVDEFDLKAVFPYDAAYLANWPAETYQMNIGDASLIAREKSLALEKEEIVANSPFQLIDVKCSNEKLVVESYSLILVPFFLANIGNIDRSLLIGINGWNGSLQSERPLAGNWFSRLFDRKRKSRRS